MDDNNKNKQNKTTRNLVTGILFVTILIAVLIVTFTLLIPYCAHINSGDNRSGNTPYNNSAPQLLSRPAKNNDVKFEFSEDFALSVNFKVTPYVNIDGLEMTFQFKDKNYNLITTKNKFIGNVTKNVVYSVSFSLSEFNFFDIFSFKWFYGIVTGGTVSYFG